MRRIATTALVTSLLFGCQATPPGEAPADDREDEIVVPDGKVDDFFSTSGKEYWVTGSSTVTIEENLAGATAAAKLVRAKQLIVLKNVAIGWFLNTYLIDKEDDESNHRYGGFSALLRFASEENHEITAVDARTFRFAYSVQVAGSRSLISKLPGTTMAGAKTITMQMGKISNEELAQLEFNHEWYREAPWSSFDPKKVAADKLESIDLQFKAQAASKDAYLAYDRLLADGELTIRMHYGWDYHSRADISGSRETYDWLIEQGFTSPVASYDKYLRTSGPLTKRITSNGKPVAVKIWIFHPGNPAKGIAGPDPDTDQGGDVLEADMNESFAKHEVIIFEGHSGPLYGFALANWKKTEHGDVDDSKIPGLTMPRNKYQIVLADGCDTYDLGQAFWQNPAKADHQNLNVITSTNFTNGDTQASAQRMLKALFNQTGGKLVPVKVSQLTRGLDANQDEGFDSMYGVHGVDANPKYDPTSDPARLGDRCTTDASCGADGNRCTKLSASRKVCTFACVDDSGCPGGSTCKAIASSTTRTITTYQCVPAAR